MKPLIQVILLALLGSLALPMQAAPVPKAILLQTTNGPTRIGAVLLSADSWRRTSARGQLVVTNPQFVCLEAGAVTATKEGESISLVLHDTRTYGPFVQQDEKDGRLTLQTTQLSRYVYSLNTNDWVQIDAELLTAERFWQRFKTGAR